MSNMALGKMSDLRPHLVLEGSFEPKTFWSKEIEEKARALEGSDFGGRSSHLWFPSYQEGKKKAKASSTKGFKGKNQTLDFFK